MTKTCGRLTGITTEHGYLSQDGEFEGTIRLEWDATQEPSDATYTGGWVVEGPKSAELMRATMTTTEWYVYHGGNLWSGPHSDRAEADRSAAECRRVCGGSPVVRPVPDRCTCYGRACCSACVLAEREVKGKGDLMRARLALPVSVALDLIACDQDEAPSVVLEMLQDAAVEAAKDAAEDTAAADAEYDQ